MLVGFSTKIGPQGKVSTKLGPKSETWLFEEYRVRFEYTRGLIEYTRDLWRLTHMLSVPVPEFVVKITIWTEDQEQAF